MKNFDVRNIFKNPKAIVALSATFPLLFIMCHEKQIQLEKLDNQISTLDKKISGAQDLRNANVPQKLRQTQSRYKSAADSLTKKADTVGICMMQNEDLLLLAYNNYAVRVGHDFQMSAFLSHADISTFQKHIATLDSGDFIQNMARARILGNCGSLNDLSYFLELLDFDSVNNELENKLAWNFYIDSTTTDQEPIETSILEFENPNINTALNNEKKLLDNAWLKNTLYDELNNSANDTIQSQDSLQIEDRDEYTPNFNIPEFDSVRTQYMRNDSLIREYQKTFDDMLNAEDTLLEYKQTMIRKRDSLVEEKNKLER